MSGFDRLMKKIKLIYLKNQMLVANAIANFIGVLLVKTLMLNIQENFATEILESPVAHWTNALFSPFAFSFVTVMTLLYEKPIRHYLNALSKHTSIPQDLEIKARQRLLNEPFVLIALDFSMWLLAAMVWSTIHWAHGSGTLVGARQLVWKPDDRPDHRHRRFFSTRAFAAKTAGAALLSRRRSFCRSENAANQNPNALVSPTLCM